MHARQVGLADSTVRALHLHPVSRGPSPIGNEVLYAVGFVAALFICTAHSAWGGHCRLLQRTIRAGGYDTW
jgi:hypothetical protein